MASDLLRRPAGIMVAMALLGACATGEPPSSDTGPAAPPTRALVRDVPYVEASAGSLVGSTAMILEWAGKGASPARLAPNIDARRPAVSVVRETRRYGRLAYPIDRWNEILHEIAAQHPVLLCLNMDGGATADDCQVVVGYDLEARKIIAHTPAGAYLERPMEEVRAGWEAPGAWALVVLPAGELPATVEKEEYIAAAAGLEEDGPAWEAVLALDSALALWQDSVDALIGLGKSLFTLGDRKGAAEAFASASQLTDDPDIARWQWALIQAGATEEREKGATARQ